MLDKASLGVSFLLGNTMTDRIQEEIANEAFTFLSIGMWEVWVCQFREVCWKDYHCYKALEPCIRCYATKWVERASTSLCLESALDLKCHLLYIQRAGVVITALVKMVRGK